MDFNLKNYQDILREIREQSPCHLLLGNGFNLSLGVQTSYKNILEEMEEHFSYHRNLQELCQSCNHDIEKIVGKLKKQIIIGSPYQNFLEKYIEGKFKFDFMKAASRIVSREIKTIYQNKNAGLNILLENFDSYFTLNYDSLLYLLLMKFKKTDDVFAFQNSMNFQAEDLDIKNGKLYKRIKQAYDSGDITTQVGGNFTTADLNKIPKSELKLAIVRHFKKQGWEHNEKSIRDTIDFMLEQEKNTDGNLSVQDGFAGNQHLFNVHNRQNLFFVHGAFHIITKGGRTQKITQTKENSLHKRLEEIIDSESQEILCVFKSDDKMEEINKSPYLKRCYEQLKKLEGSLVIIGSSLDDNDRHIFDAINDSQVQTTYISIFGDRKSAEKSCQRAKEIFKKKNLVFFDAKSISYM